MPIEFAPLDSEEFEYASESEGTSGDNNLDNDDNSDNISECSTILLADFDFNLTTERLSQFNEEISLGEPSSPASIEYSPSASPYDFAQETTDAEDSVEGNSGSLDLEALFNINDTSLLEILDTLDEENLHDFCAEIESA